MKPKRYKDVVKLLTQHGFVMVRSSGHQIFACGGVSVALSHQRIVSVGVMRTVEKAIKQVLATPKQVKYA